MSESSRMNERFVPKFGPIRFRAFVGILFLPYTGMCVSFAIIGSLLSHLIFWDRLVAIFVIYFLSVGVSAHAGGQSQDPGKLNHGEITLRDQNLLL